jgi:hypothetical protein
MGPFGPKHKKRALERARICDRLINEEGRGCQPKNGLLPASGSDWPDTGEMAHLAARPGLGLAVEVQHQIPFGE